MTDAKPPTLSCSGTASVTGGTIQFAGMAPVDGKAPDVFAVVGGTGVYVGAKGSLTDERTDEDRARTQVTLQP